MATAQAEESMVYWKRQGNGSEHWLLLRPQQFAREQSADALLDKIGENTVLYSACQSLVKYCVIMAYYYPQNSSAYIRVQEFPFQSRHCDSQHNSRSKREKDFIDDFQIQSRNAIKSILANTHAVTWRKSSFASPWRSSNENLICESCSALARTLA